MPSTTGISRDTLLVEVKSAHDEAERISQAFKTDEKGRFTIPRQQKNDYVAAVERGKEAKGLLDAMDQADGLGQYLDEPAGVPASAGGQGRSSQDGAEFKSLGDMLLGSEQFQAAKGAGFESGRFKASMEGKSIFNMSAGSVTLQAFGSKQDLGITEMQRRQWHIRDLFPKSTTTAPILYGIRETGWVNNAAQVRQRYAADGVSLPTGGPTDVFGRAPKSNVLFKPVTFPVAEIAHTLDAHKNILADEPRLKQLLNTRMLEMVKFREDEDLLHSVGDGERITGLFNTPGIQQYPGLRSDKHSIQVRRAITKALLAEYQPTGLVLSPSMWEELEIETDDTGAFRIALAVAVGAEKRVWRLNVVETTAMADEQFLIGAFGMGAQIHDRESVSVTVSTENARNFEEGVITIRADERLALEVNRPESFVVGSWDAADAA